MRMPCFTASVNKQSSMSCTVPMKGSFRSAVAGVIPSRVSGSRTVTTRVPGRRFDPMEQTSPLLPPRLPKRLGIHVLRLRALRDAEIDEPADEVWERATLIAGPLLQLHELLLGQEDVHPHDELGFAGGGATSPRRRLRFRHMVPRRMGTRICGGLLRVPCVCPSG